MAESPQNDKNEPDHCAGILIHNGFSIDAVFFANEKTAHLPAWTLDKIAGIGLFNMFHAGVKRGLELRIVCPACF